MSFWTKIKAYVADIANISDHIDLESAEETIRRNIYFKGPNVWILACAIIIASVGLNVNSIPVIIGAMLISPIMGPIIGFGLALGTNDSGLLKDALKNLLVMLVISLMASFIYFLISPLNPENPTELAARTSPSIYDVLIALFGGTAGIFELCRKDKGTVLSGVAIATALMPPICTAGYGLANLNGHYFFGAMYLFLINCTFIILATYVVVRYLGFPQVKYLDEKRARKNRTWITIVSLAVIIPSIWSAVNIIKDNNFRQKASAFTRENKFIGNRYLYDYKINSGRKANIELFYSGESLSDEESAALQQSAANYGISQDHLVVNTSLEPSKERVLLEESKEFIKEIYERTDHELNLRDVKIKELQGEVDSLRKKEVPAEAISRELKAQYPGISSVKIGRVSSGAVAGEGGEAPVADRETIVVLVSSRPLLGKNDTDRIVDWLKVRLGEDEVIIYNEKSPSSDKASSKEP